MDQRPSQDSFYSAIIEDDDIRDSTPDPNQLPRSLPRTRSLSDGGPSAAAKLLSPSPHIVAAARRTKDDSSLKDSTLSTPVASSPSTPNRDQFSRRSLNLHVPNYRDPSPARTASGSPFHGSRVGPLSPKLDHSQVFASPTNILPRRSRGLDFSRAATSLHHSTLADQSSPDSSPTMGGRAMNIPSRRSGDFSSTEQSSNSLWSVMGNQEKMHISSSLGSVPGIVPSDSSSSSDDDLMDEDMDETYLTTPQAKAAMSLGPVPAPWSLGGSPAASSLMSFQQRQRPKKQPKRRLGGSLCLGLGGVSSSGISKSPPSGTGDGSHSRRDSISWQANQLHLSGSEGEDGKGPEGILTTPSRDGQRNVIRRVVTRRGNLLPKTKGFARIRAALAEEVAPVEADMSREAEVVRHVIESDVPTRRDSIALPPHSTTSTTHSSPALNPQESADDLDDVMNDSGLGIGFKLGAKGLPRRMPWDTSDSSSYTTPPPPPFRPRGSSNVSEDVCMDSPQQAVPTTGFAVPRTAASSDSQRSDGGGGPPYHGTQPPSVAEITRRINTKRRRDDDLDPVALKRRAVSPSVSVHNSPIMQSPMQRDAAPWGSRPGSNSGEAKGNGSSGVSEAGSVGNGNGRAPSKGRVGFQGMVDTHDGLMRMSIE
ncbi:uncharacterized protein DNG_07712 [Cephalotrichum gorgonifer]|uniref:Uncharacterized protein n=1 Tax=Cephalotrichum gorgonifer TaxID=2041049 RepID=A0AAE8SYH3_9PEZI|nr:uncharacterized protein DNG_07712 [Cephalotrichum gorgonifer]